jgi:hypothetical protein
MLDKHPGKILTRVMMQIPLIKNPVIDTYDAECCEHAINVGACFAARRRLLLDRGHCLYHRSGPGRELTLAYEQGFDETTSRTRDQVSPSPWRVPTQGRPFLS